jgi:hypothetical protein
MDRFVDGLVMKVQHQDRHHHHHHHHHQDHPPSQIFLKRINGSRRDDCPTLRRRGFGANYVDAQHRQDSKGTIDIERERIWKEGPRLGARLFCLFENQAHTRGGGGGYRRPQIDSKSSMRIGL